ncbi:hypothetical protein ACGFSI_19750 [Streptomyces virginiae]|uniref:hypothetical protein n=1 Tax=Streptomyces virginiae TaxID=1961 RepID=UPI003711FFE9
MYAHSQSVLVRPDPRRLAVLAAPAVLVGLTEGLTGSGRVLPRPVWLVLGAAAVVFCFVLRWAGAVSVADGYITVRRGLTIRRLTLAHVDSVYVEEMGSHGHVIRCRPAGAPDLKVPLTVMRPSDQRLVIEAIRAAVRPGVLRASPATKPAEARGVGRREQG